MKGAPLRWGGNLYMRGMPSRGQPITWGYQQNRAAQAQYALRYQPPPQKYHLLFFSKSSLKSANCPRPPFQAILSLYRLFVNQLLKVGFFSERSKYQSFSTLTPSYLLKATKFLDKICQFEFLVMTEENIFVYKLLLSLNISDISCKIAMHHYREVNCSKSSNKL